MKKFFSYIGAITVLLIILTPLCFRKKEVRTETLRTERDTLVIRDTIRDTIPHYREKYITRVDTIYLPATDSLQKEHKVVIPIEQKTYVTDDYHAVVEGYNPALTYMEVYKNTEYITQTEYIRQYKKSRYNLGIQVGIGRTRKEFSPYIGIGFQYNLFGW
ncbi:MAG: hypothetical protein LUE93_13350 [Bacteroides sp.]|nr:hypothetical protein [Bacteroides sp.]